MLLTDVATIVDNKRSLKESKNQKKVEKVSKFEGGCVEFSKE